MRYEFSLPWLRRETLIVSKWFRASLTRLLVSWNVCALCCWSKTYSALPNFQQVSKWQCIIFCLNPTKSSSSCRIYACSRINLLICYIEAKYRKMFFKVSLCFSEEGHYITGTNDMWMLWISGPGKGAAFHWMQIHRSVRNFAEKTHHILGLLQDKHSITNTLTMQCYIYIHHFTSIFCS